MSDTTERAYQIADATVKIRGGRHFTGPYGETLASYDAYLEIPGQSKPFHMSISVAATVSPVDRTPVGTDVQLAAAFNRLAYRLYHRVDLPAYVAAWLDKASAHDALLLKLTDGKIAKW